MWCVANAKFLGSLFSQLSKFARVLRFLLLGKRILVLPTVNFVTQLILGQISSNGVSLPEWLSVTAFPNMPRRDAKQKHSGVHQLSAAIPTLNTCQRSRTE